MLKLLNTAQFMSAFADNAILFFMIVLLKNGSYPSWATPVLQEMFIISYIVLAPFVGVIADTTQKNKIMIIANVIKAFGVLLVILLSEPFVAYLIIGVGAVIYSPAKYGILIEQYKGDALVKANGYLESATIVAIIMGALFGGVISDTHSKEGFIIVLVLYVLASLVSTLIGANMPSHNREAGWLTASFKSFYLSFRRILTNIPSRISLFGTSSFWAIGITIRFLLLVWVPVVYNITTNDVPAYLNACVAVGVVLGALLIAKVKNIRARFGYVNFAFFMPLLLVVLMLSTNIYFSGVLLLLMGLFGGMFIIPLNALLQEEGEKLIGSGMTIAIQNFVENILMLVSLGGYILLKYIDVPIKTTGILFAIIFMVLLLWLKKLELRIK